MITVAGALLPVFLLIVAGYAFKRRGFVPDSFWPPAEKMTYYVFFPALLVANLAEAKLDGLPVVELGLAEAAGVLALTAAALILRRAGVPPFTVAGPAFTSIIQGLVRPNTYVGLAAAASLYKAPGVTLTAICIAVVVPLVNVISVAAMVNYAQPSGSAPGWRAMVLPVAKNPLILACLIGILLNWSGIGLPFAVGAFLKILGSASLPVGLLAVGAGLDLAALRVTGGPVMATSVAKVILLPLATLAACLAFGIDGITLGVAVMYAALPCSASSYVLARQMGGDAPLMANIITATTVLAAVTLPAFLLVFAGSP